MLLIKRSPQEHTQAEQIRQSSALMGACARCLATILRTIAIKGRSIVHVQIAYMLPLLSSFL